MKKFLSFIFVAMVFSTTLLGLEVVRTGIRGIPTRFQGSYNTFNTHDMINGKMNNIGLRMYESVRMTSNTAHFGEMTLRIEGTGSQLSNPWLLKTNVIFQQYYSENMEGIIFSAKDSNGNRFLLFMLWTPVDNLYMISYINLSTGIEHVYSVKKR